jgi:hypothetical protein
MTDRNIRIVGTLALVLLFGYLVAPWRMVFGQATSGYTKIASVNFGTNTYTDSTVTAGQVSDYEVTAANAAGESAPSNIVTLTTPSTTATHSNVLTWTPGSGGGAPTSYNVYRLTVTVPVPPTGLAGVAN